MLISTLMSYDVNEVKQVKNYISAIVFRGELPEGALLNEGDLRSKTGVSVRAVKQALVELAQAGIVVRKRHVGTRLNRRPEAPMVISASQVQAIALLSPYHESNAGSWYFSSILHGIRSKLASPQTIVKYFNAQKECASPMDAPVLNIDESKRTVQGVMAVELNNYASLNALVQHGLPVVAIDYAPEEGLFDSVSADFFRAGFKATCHLMELGHRRIAFVGEMGTPYSTDASWQERAAGYMHALSMRGEAEPSPLMLGGKRNEEHITRHLREFHRQYAPTAYVLASGVLALPLIQQLGEMGLRVPDDISISSADGVDGVANGMVISRVYTEPQEIGSAAMDALIVRCTHRMIAPIRTLIRGRLIVGQSATVRR